MTSGTGAIALRFLEARPPAGRRGAPHVKCPANSKRTGCVSPYSAAGTSSGKLSRSVLNRASANEAATMLDFLSDGDEMSRPVGAVVSAPSEIHFDNAPHIS